MTFQPIESFLPILSAERQIDILTHNKVIADFLAKIETCEEKIAIKDGVIAETETELARIDDEIADLKSRLKTLDSTRGEVLGRKNQAAHHKRLAQRQANETRARIGVFAKSVIQRECERELKSIGKTLRMPGRRGGDLQVLDIKDAYPRVGDPGSGASLGDYRKAKGQEYEISREAKPPVPEPLFPDDHAGESPAP